MIRQYGGVNLGPRQFKIIEDLAEIALEKLEEMKVRRRDKSPNEDSSSPLSSPASAMENDNTLQKADDQTSSQQEPTEEESHVAEEHPDEGIQND